MMLETALNAAFHVSFAQTLDVQRHAETENDCMTFLLISSANIKSDNLEGLWMQ